MGHRLELAAKALAVERVATGGLAAIVPDRAIGAIAAPGSDTEAARYLALLLGIRQVVRGAMLWRSREDRASPIPEVDRIGRRWITTDLGRFSIHTTRKRLLANPDVRPFVV